MNSEHTPFEEALDEIMREESEPSYEVLTRWINRYPEHREALSSFFATWAVQERSPKEEPLDEARAGQRMVSQALNLLYQQSAAKAVETKKAHAQAPRLCEIVKSSGFSLEEIGDRCGLDESIMLKLDRRLIRFLSIPFQLFERLSAALSRRVDAIKEMFMGDPIAAGANKAKGKPVIKTEDFLDAVRASDLPVEAKAEWARVVAAGEKE
jgi:hypothetical protein